MKKSFTLIEVLIAVGIAGMIIVVIAQFIVYFAHLSFRAAAYNQLNSEARNVLNTLSRETALAIGRPSIPPTSSAPAISYDSVTGTLTVTDATKLEKKISIVPKTGYTAIQESVTPATVSGSSQTIYTPMDIMLVLDHTGSMGDPSGIGGTKLDALKRAINGTPGFINTILAVNQASGTETNRIGLAKYSTCDTNDAEILNNLTADYTTLSNKVNSLTDCGATPMAAGIKKANDYLETSSDVRPEAKKIIVLFSDGMANVGGPCNDPDVVSRIQCAIEAAITQANNGRVEGLEYYSLGLGTGVALDECTLRKVANDYITDNCQDDPGVERYFNAASAADLNQAFQALAEKMIDTTTYIPGNPVNFDLTSDKVNISGLNFGYSDTGQPYLKISFTISNNVPASAPSWKKVSLPVETIISSRDYKNEP